MTFVSFRLPTAMRFFVPTFGEGLLLQLRGCLPQGWPCEIDKDALVEVLFNSETRPAVRIHKVRAACVLYPTAYLFAREFSPQARDIELEWSRLHQTLNSAGVEHDKFAAKVQMQRLRGVLLMEVKRHCTPALEDVA
jgi:hypothetical protein